MSRGRSLTWFVPEPASWKNQLALRLLHRQAWHPDHSAGSVWIRSFQMAPYLEKLGYSVNCNNLSTLPQVAIFLRRHTAEDLELAMKLKAQGVKIITEVVVNYFETRLESQAGYGASPVDRSLTFTRLVELADQVWAVSPFLTQLASQVNPNSYFVSDSVDPHHFPTKNKRSASDTQPLTIGWSGVANKAHVIDDLFDQLQPWLVNGRARLLLSAERSIQLKSSLAFEFDQWRYSSFPALVQKCDLCLAPRQVDNNYDRGHSLFKIGVFMAMGVPALAGPVPSYDLLLADRQGGVICSAPEEWKYQLERFICDADLRFMAGEAAKEKMQPYLTPKIAEEIHQLLERL